LKFIIKLNNAFNSSLAILAALDSNLIANLGLREYSFCMPMVLGSTIAFAAFALVAVVMCHTFDWTGLILLCSFLRFRVWVWFH